MFGLGKKLREELNADDGVGREAGRLLAEEQLAELAKEPKTVRDIIRHRYYDLEEWTQTRREALQAALDAISRPAEVGFGKRREKELAEIAAVGQAVGQALAKAWQKASPPAKEASLEERIVWEIGQAELSAEPLGERMDRVYRKAVSSQEPSP